MTTIYPNSDDSNKNVQKRTIAIICGSVLLIVFIVTVCMWIAQNYGHAAFGDKGDRGIEGQDSAAGPFINNEKDSIDRIKNYALTKAEAKSIIAKYPAKDGANPQFVLLAFDGSRSLPMWEQSRAFAKEMNASNTPLHFTYFINAVYLLEPKFHRWFASPGQQPGVSNIGFATSREDVMARIAQINAAYKEGHEIGSHNVGHYDGGTWTFEQWTEQFDIFDKIVLHPETMRPEYHIDVPPSELVGFRAPNLSINHAMFLALKERHFLYDASRTAAGLDFPYKDENGLWELPLPTVTIGPADKRGRSARVLAMDYNLFLRDTKGKDIAKKGTALWDTLHEQTVDAFVRQFNGQYMVTDAATGQRKAGKRAPIYFASHFSSWNDGVYWESMKDFARAVCGKPEVYCVTYKDLAMWMEAKEALANPGL